MMKDNQPHHTDPNAHYHIGTRTSVRYDLPSWLGENVRDPVFKVSRIAFH